MPDPPMRPQADQVLVRMYGQGLGDCFLLAFPRAGADGSDDARPVYVLIDCGVLSGTPDSSERMRQIVADIRRTTADGKLKPASDRQPRGHLDLLIVTHEHWDHLSGFIYGDAQEAWQAMQVDAVWMGWTADHERDELGKVLQQIKDLQERALATIAEQAQRFGLSDELRVAASLNRFLADAMQARGRSLASGLDFVKRLCRNGCTYCEPGEVRPVPGTESVAYVLGPPRKWSFLSKMNPSSRAPETFENPLALRVEMPDDPALAEIEQLRALRRIVDEPSPLNGFVAALNGRLAAATESSGRGNDNAALNTNFYRAMPFDRSFRIPLAIAEAEAVNTPGAYPAFDAYFESINHWRRIDTDWFLTAETFALAADNFINNTSLVLAFELPPAKANDRRNVLLFVADAQVGNWLSWDEIPAWTPRDGAQPAQAGQKPDIGDLLRRTVFYKVGHHGSHNATLKEKGVERMAADGTLTAFVPVSPPVAHNVGWEEMPLQALLDALAQRTDGRVVLPGGVWPHEEDPAKLAAARQRIGVEVSSQMLPEKQGDDGALLEAEVPLWTQIAVRY